MTTAPLPTMGDVAVLHWPDDDHLRTKLERDEQARILIVDAHCEPPAVRSDLEDWIREPTDLLDLQTRMDTLRVRAFERARRPRIDEHGLVHVGPDWVAIPEAQVPIVELFVERFGRLVEREEVLAVYTEAGNSGHDMAVAAVMNRLARRLAEVGLALRSVRARGHVLEFGKP